MNYFLLTFLFQFLFFILLHLSLFFWRPRKKIFLYLIIFIQIVFSAMLRKEIGDVMLFSGAGWHLRHRLDFYFIDQGHSQYPFFPLLIFPYALFNLLTETFSFFTFSFYLKLFLLLPSLYLISKLILQRQKKHSNPWRQLQQMQFLSHPLVYAIVVFHGQTDVVLLSLFLFFIFYQQKKKITAAFFYSLSVLAKTWSILFLPLIVKFEKKWQHRFTFLLILFITLMADIFIYTRLVEGSSFRTVLPAVLKAGGAVGDWGLPFLISLLFPSLVQLIKLKSLLFFIILFSLCQWLIYKKKTSFLESIFLTILSFYLVLSKWAGQYLFWIWPFIFLIKEKLRSKNYNLFSFLSTIYIFLYYFQVIIGKEACLTFIVNLAGLCLWGFLLFWFVSFLRKN